MTTQTLSDISTLKVWTKILTSDDRIDTIYKIKDWYIFFEDESYWSQKTLDEHINLYGWKLLEESPSFDIRKELNQFSFITNDWDDNDSYLDVEALITWIEDNKHKF